MQITNRQAQSLLPALYHTAEKDPSDIIANAASVLAVRFENANGNGFILNSNQPRLIRYAVQNKPADTQQEPSRRKTYKRRVSLA